MKRYMVKEVACSYHLITIDDELSIQSVISQANDIKSRFDTGYEAIDAILKLNEDKYGFEYDVEPNACGTDCVDLEVIDEVD